MTDRPHCWHVTAFFVQTNPPQVLEVCCWCGDTRTQAIGFGNNVGEHGSFKPDQGFMLEKPVCDGPIKYRIEKG